MAQQDVGLKVIPTVPCHYCTAADRVQVSPMSMMVAVAVWSSPPPQHSPMLGHRASSHTCGAQARIWTAVHAAGLGRD